MSPRIMGLPCELRDVGSRMSSFFHCRFLLFSTRKTMHSESRFSLSTLPWFLGPLLFGCLALYLGQDANWDLRNYHLYNAYAFLFHRNDFDVLPAQVATFYNPLLYIPFYELVTRASPRMVGFLLGAAQGLNFPILIGIARRTLSRDTLSWWRYYLVGLIGVLGAGNIAETGTMFADNLLSLLILGSLWLLLANYRHLTERRMSHAFRLIGFAGYMMGMAAGLKQPAAIFAVGWCLAFWVIPVSFARRISLAFFFGIGVLAGFATTGGYWMYTLWQRFANPLFPYFNQVFHSPMASTASYRDTRFLPTGLKDALLYPFRMVIDPRCTGEIFFRDIRFALFCAVFAVALFYITREAVTHRRLLRDEVKSGSANQMLRYNRLFLLAGGLIAYAVWLKLFGIYRYLLPLEMLAPLGIYLLITTFPWRPWLHNAAMILCAVLMVATLRPGNWGRVNWGTSYFGFVPPPLQNPDQAMVLMTGVAPMAYAIPFFSRTVRFVRIQSYFTGPSDTPNGYDVFMRDLIAKHHGPLYVLYQSYEKETGGKALDAYGMAIDQDSCKELRPHIEEHLKSHLVFCTLLKKQALKKEGNNQ